MCSRSVQFECSMCAGSFLILTFLILCQVQHSLQPVCSARVWKLNKRAKSFKTNLCNGMKNGVECLESQNKPARASCFGRLMKSGWFLLRLNLLAIQVRESYLTTHHQHESATLLSNGGGQNMILCLCF